MDNLNLIILMCIWDFTLFSQISGTADAEIKNPSGGNQGLSKVPYF